MNFKFYILISLIILLQTVKGFTKKEILKLDLKQYQTGECPEFSGGRKSSFNCSYNFYCIDDDNCQPDKDFTSPYFEYTEKDGNIKKYIKHMCTELDYKTNSCSTETCSTDSDCISNHCFNSTCIAQGESLFTECSDLVDDSDKEIEVQMIKCGKPEGEICKSDKQCAGRCLSNACKSNLYLTPTNPIPVQYFLYIGGGIILLLVILCICCCCWCCRRRST